jgi:hypothetical protein
MVAAKTSLVWEPFLFGVIDRNEDLAQKAGTGLIL